MDKFLKKQFYIWTYDKIRENPKKFGSDFGNSLIMHEYITEFYSEHRVYELVPQLMSVLSSVSRIRNKLLEKNPQFDFRIKFKRKNKFTSPINENEETRSN